ncbi:hypothetical protein Cni_G06659 [Canna indica]|uniref:Uncharacterized protein n=1 Tax=Canna indica TaxID=4628 RepID=A0AAQ3JXF3_9LILI|nr:hypothetical protein Cni_G06659 [Canna indica]
METHLEEDELVAFVENRKRKWEGTVVASEGKSGGIIMLWEKNKWNVRVIFKDTQSINILVELSKGKIFMLSGVYASVNVRKRNLLWKILGEVEVAGIPWMLVGEMNGIVEANEK